MDYKDETIAAIATPIGVGGIGIIKISGKTAVDIAQQIFRPKWPLKSLDNFRLHLGHIIDPKSSLPLDEVLLSVMRGPFSYTREDVVEINSHSGYIILSNILQLILQSGARLAQPGEFTLRAFLNGRIDLTQAEAIIDLINAKSDTSVRLAANQLVGGLNARINETRHALCDILIKIEASIDFPDEESTSITRPLIIDHLHSKILEPIKEIISDYSQRKIWHEGIGVVIAGRVNTGKSSILNRLLQKEKALVTPIPGTTRDILEYGVTIEGIPLKMVDTAGIRKVRGTVEKKGVELTRAQLASADITLFVIDRSRALNQYDYDLLHIVNKTTSIVVVNKIDLPARVSEKMLSSFCRNLPRADISALTGEGFQGLKEAIFNRVIDKTGGIALSPIVPNLRQTVALKQARDLLENASVNLQAGLPLEIVAADLSWAKDSIDEITGIKINEEILHGIFSKLCIGK
jgi:tRNA modification GTPase